MNNHKLRQGRMVADRAKEEYPVRWICQARRDDLAGAPPCGWEVRYPLRTADGECCDECGALRTYNEGAE